MTPRVQEKISIPLHSIKEGVSEYKFRSKFVESEVLTGCEFREKIDVSLKITKGGADYLCEISVRSVGHFICDRCLEEFDREVKASSAVLYTYDKSSAEMESESLHVLSASADEIDISSDVIDILLLEVPAKKLCMEDCKGLCPVCGKNLNTENCSCVKDEIDPRWQGLRNIDFSK